MHLAWQSNERSKAMILLQQPPVKVTSIEYWTKLVDNDVASHLLSLYFTWENPTWQLIDQALFVHDLEHRRGRFCSSLLVHTLLFFGCVRSIRFWALSTLTGSPELLIQPRPHHRPPRRKSARREALLCHSTPLATGKKQRGPAYRTVQHPNRPPLLYIRVR